MSILSNVHPMGVLSRGGAAAVMESAQDGKPAVIMKNSKPYRVVSTVSDYEHAQELEEDVVLLSMALHRLENSGPIIGEKFVLEELGISPSEISEMDEVELA